LNAEVQRALDRQAILELLYLYCRACDRADETLLRSCFHPDSQHRHGGFEGSSADFCTLALRIIRSAKVTKHMLTNAHIELAGEIAFSESHYQGYHCMPNQSTRVDEDHFAAGRYLDRFERREGRWRIAQRIGLCDFERFDPPSARGLASLPARARSLRLPDDELYAVLGVEASRRLP
jgi:hypothetical protein